MIDCSKKSFIHFCQRRELINLPQLEFVLYQNIFKFFNQFSTKKFEQWITKIFNSNAIPRKKNCFKLISSLY